MQLYYFEIGNTLKLSVVDIEYRLLDHLVAQMTITGFKTCFQWEVEQEKIQDKWGEIPFKEIRTSRELVEK